MKILGVWIIVIVVCTLGSIGIVKIDDLESVFKENSMWWHVPAFIVCGAATIRSGILIFNRIFG